MQQFPQYHPDMPIPQVRTITRQYRNADARMRDEANMIAFGWSVQSVTVIPGGYNGTAGCFLAIIFLPLALLAGKKEDGFVVIYGTTAPPGMATLPVQVA